MAAYEKQDAAGRSAARDALHVWSGEQLDRGPRNRAKCVCAGIRRGDQCHARLTVPLETGDVWS